MANVGDKIKIIYMEGEPQYSGKVGVIEKINEGCRRYGFPEQWHGTWGGCAVQPEHDRFVILEKCK